MRTISHLPGRIALPLLVALALLAPDAGAQGAQRKQQILFDEIPEHAVGDQPFDIAAKATSGLPLSFVVVSGPAVLDGRKVKLTGAAGLVIIRASQDGNAVFQAAKDAERAFAVHAMPSAPTIVSGPMGLDVAIGDAVVLSVEASGAPAPALQWRKNGTPVDGAAERTFSIAAASLADAGSYDVVASNASGHATSAPARVAVGKRRQHIQFQSANTSAAAGQQVALNANSTSGLPVRFEVVSGAGILSGDTLTSQGGTVIVQASQPGDDTYEAAMPVTQTYLFTSNQGQHGP
jgi:hypothetical protein